MTLSLTTVTAGFVVGALVGLTGMGGSALMTPFLVLVLRVPPVFAVGTDMVYSSITKIFGGWQHARQQTVDWQRVGWLATGSLPASVLSLGLMAFVQRRYSLAFANQIAGHLLGGVLVLVAAVMLWHSLGRAREREQVPSRWRVLEGPRKRLAYALVGAGVGTLVAFTSVGGGSLLFVTLLVASCLPTVRIVGTDIAHAALISTIDAVAHLLLGNVQWPLVAGLIIGSLPGVWLGSKAAVHLPERWLRFGVATVLLSAGLKLV